jgi:hypothetical protein
MRIERRRRAPDLDLRCGEAVTARRTLTPARVQPLALHLRGKETFGEYHVPEQV